MAALGALERKVMNVLWASMGTDRTVRDVATTLPSYAYTTVLTVLERLTQKGVVLRTKDGRVNHYRAAASREEHAAELMREALGASVDPNAVLVHFAQTVTPEEAVVLRAALAGGVAGVPDRGGRGVAAPDRERRESQVPGHRMHDVAVPVPEST